MRHLEKRKGPLAATPPKSDWLAGKSFTEDSDLRHDAQRRRAMKLVAGTGLSMAVGMVLVTIACDAGASR